MKAKNLEKLFDDGKDTTPYLATSKARRPGYEPKCVDVDFPTWMIESLDAQATRLGVTRQFGDQSVDRRAIEGRTKTAS
jgi:hypothetical protein